MVTPASRQPRKLVRHAIATSMLVLAAVPTGALPALGAVTQDSPNLVLDYDFEGDLSSGTVTDRSPSGLSGTLANPAAATSQTETPRLALTARPHPVDPSLRFRLTASSSPRTDLRHVLRSPKSPVQGVTSGRHTNEAA